MRLHLAQPKPLLQILIQKQNSSPLQQKGINAKANTPVVPADKAKTGDVIAVDVKKLAHLLKQTAQTITTNSVNYQTTQLSRSRHNLLAIKTSVIY